MHLYPIVGVKPGRFVCDMYSTLDCNVYKQTNGLAFHTQRNHEIHNLIHGSSNPSTNHRPREQKRISCLPYLTYNIEESGPGRNLAIHGLSENYSL